MQCRAFRFALILSAGACLGLHPAAARATDEAASAESADHPENDGPEIIVTGRLIAGKSDPISAPVVLQGDNLTRQLKTQIGDMLKTLPGVSASGFAPGVSRPVLRGFDGPRVQVLVDGIGSLDASSVSPDHAVSLDTLTIERVDVLHGPRVLLYASDPAGGVVNAVGKRIPRAVPDTTVKLDALASYGTAASAVSTGAALDLRLTDRLAAHFDASYNHSDNLHVGGYVLSPQLRAQVLAKADDLGLAGDAPGAARLRAQALRRGSIANSGAKSWSLASGIAFLDAGGDIGVSVQRLADDYGIPPRPSPDPASTSISLRQTRVDLRAGLNLGGFLKRLELRAGFGDYAHSELEGDEVGTTFRSEAIEARLEAQQARRGPWSGTSGVQYASGRLDVSGAELLLPDYDTQRVAAFTLQQLQVGSFDLEGALRAEHTSIRNITEGVSRSFTQYSAVAGIAWHPADRVTLSLSYFHGERAPSPEELYVDGAHDATQSYERGNPAFTVERSDGIEAALRYNGGDLAGSLTLFGTNFGNFITSVPTGEVIEDFPVFQYVQAPARFRGIEAEGALTFARRGDMAFKVDGGVDYIRAKLVGIGPVPRIPPLRARGGLEVDAPALTVRGEVEWNAKQDRVTTYENPTSAFTLVNLSATWRPLGQDGPVSLILAVDNLLDANGRLAASETRDFVPIAGRDVRLTAKLSF